MGQGSSQMRAKRKEEPVFCCEECGGPGQPERWIPSPVVVTGQQTKKTGAPFMVGPKRVKSYDLSRHRTSWVGFSVPFVIKSQMKLTKLG